MAIRCEKCDREYDVTLFQFGRTVQCDCGSIVTLSGVQTIRKDEAPTRLILVRHGETDWNRESRLQGHLPTLLNARGRHEAKLLARRISEEQPNRLYSSDLPRAMETAEMIAEATGLEIMAAPELREAHFGKWEGKTYAEVQDESPGNFNAWVESDFRQAPPGGESAGELRERIIAFLAEVALQHPNETSVLVSHGGPCKYAIAHTLGISPTGIHRYAVDNASVHIIEIGAYGWRLTTLNDTCHLREVAEHKAAGPRA